MTPKKGEAPAADAGEDAKRVKAPTQTALRQHYLLTEMSSPMERVEYQDAVVFNSGIESLATPFESGTEITGAVALRFVTPYLDIALKYPLSIHKPTTMRLISACTFSSYTQFLQALKAAILDAKLEAFEDAFDNSLPGKTLRRLLLEEEEGFEGAMLLLLRSSLHKILKPVQD